jgi:hypothetical protein
VDGARGSVGQPHGSPAEAPDGSAVMRKCFPNLGA